MSDNVDLNDIAIKAIIREINSRVKNIALYRSRSSAFC